MQAKFQKVLEQSMALQRVPAKSLTWMAPKQISKSIKAFPFSIDIGNNRIFSTVYLIDNQYFVTTPILDTKDNFRPVPDISPPMPIDLSISPSLFPLGNFPSSGSPNAQNTLIEFADDQCHTCRKWNREVLPLVQKEKNIRFVYIPYPIVVLHPNALDAAIFEMCAEQTLPGSFWDVHNLLNNRIELGSLSKDQMDSALKGIIATKTLPAAKMNACIKTQQPLAEIQGADDTLLSHTGIPNVPTFIADGHVVTGYQSLENIKKLFVLKSPSPPLTSAKKP
jgi:protein-disulfide isomerase